MQKQHNKMQTKICFKPEFAILKDKMLLKPKLKLKPKTENF